MFTQEIVRACEVCKWCNSIAILVREGEGIYKTDQVAGFEQGTVARLPISTDFMNTISLIHIYPHYLHIFFSLLQLSIRLQLPVEFCNRTIDLALQYTIALLCVKEFSDQLDSRTGSPCLYINIRNTRTMSCTTLSAVLYTCSMT